METKKFEATIERNGDIEAHSIFNAKNLDEAKSFAQMWKRREGHKGSVYVRLFTELDKN